MPTTTTNLGLNKTDTTPDGSGSFVDKNEYFNFDTDLNDNWDVIDTAIGDLSNLTTAEKGNLVGAVNEINANLPDVSNLANKDLSNLSATGKTKVATLAHELDWNNKITITTTPSNSARTYVCPDDGLVSVSAYGTGNTNANKTVTAQVYDNGASISMNGGGLNVASAVSVASEFQFGSMYVQSQQTIGYMAQSAGFSHNYAEVYFIPFKKQ